MNIGKAVEAIHEGKMARRKEWNPDFFIFKQVPSEVKKDIVPKMQSLPQSVKDAFERRFNDPNEQIDAIYYSNQVALVQQSNLITAYTPTVIDLLANDWEIFDL